MDRNWNWNWKKDAAFWKKVLCIRTIFSTIILLSMSTLALIKFLQRSMIPIVWIKTNNNAKWLFYGYFWPFFRQLYVYLSQNWDSEGHFDVLNRSKIWLVLRFDTKCKYFHFRCVAILYKIHIWVFCVFAFCVITFVPIRI